MTLNIDNLAGGAICLEKTLRITRVNSYQSNVQVNWICMFSNS